MGGLLNITLNPHSGNHQILYSVLTVKGPGKSIDNEDNLGFHVSLPGIEKCSCSPLPHLGLGLRDPHVRVGERVSNTVVPLVITAHDSSNK